MEWKRIWKKLTQLVHKLGVIAEKRKKKKHSGIVRKFVNSTAVQFKQPNQPNKAQVLLILFLTFLQKLLETDTIRILFETTPFQERNREISKTIGEEMVKTVGSVEN